jgi:DNA-binding transcriptional regulator YiaG
MPRNTDFALLIRVTRAAFGISHEELAALLGVPADLVRRWESGETKPGDELLQTTLDCIEQEVRRRTGSSPRDGA